MFAHNATAAEHHGGLSSQTIDAILPEVRRAFSHEAREPISEHTGRLVAQFLPSLLEEILQLRAALELIADVSSGRATVSRANTSHDQDMDTISHLASGEAQITFYRSATS